MGSSYEHTNGPDVNKPSTAAVSRRAWLASYLHKASEAVAERVEDEVARRATALHGPLERRPPGAVPEPQFLALCDRCGDCVNACPHAAILTYPDTAGAQANTPVMRPERRPCHLCDDYPCIAACPTGALRAAPSLPPSDGIERTALWSLGTVSLDCERCFAYSGPECGACVGWCPGDLEAIRLVGWRPRLDPETCVGCGLCIEACPMTPPAISMEPVHSDNQGWRQAKSGEPQS